MRFKKSPQLPGAGSRRAWHQHGSHTPTSPEAILLSKMACQPKHFGRQCTYLKFQYLNESYPNPIMIPAIQKYVTDNALIGMLNSARKKSERLNSICNHLK